MWSSMANSHVIWVNQDWVFHFLSRSKILCQPFSETEGIVIPKEPQEWQAFLQDRSKGDITFLK